MPNAALLLLQVASTIGPPIPDEAGASGSLRTPVPPKSCVAKAGEIVVCGKEADSYRLSKGVAQGPEDGLPKAEWKVFGNAQMSAHSVQRTIAPGVSAPAAMVTIKVPF